MCLHILEQISIRTCAARGCFMLLQAKKEIDLQFLLIYLEYFLTGQFPRNKKASLQSRGKDIWQKLQMVPRFHLCGCTVLSRSFSPAIASHSWNVKGDFPVGFIYLLLYISTSPVSFSILNWFLSPLYHLILMTVMERSNYCIL